MAEELKVWKEHKLRKISMVSTISSPNRILTGADARVIKTFLYLRTQGEDLYFSLVKEKQGMGNSLLISLSQYVIKRQSQ